MFILPSKLTFWFKTYISPLVIFVVLSVLVTWPLVRNFSTAITGIGDARHHLWILWHTKEALFSPESFFHTRLLYFPYGTTLLTSALGPLMGVFALPFWHWGPEAAYNGALLIGFALSGYFMYILVLGLGFSKKVSFLAGSYYLMAPIHLTAVYGHLNKVFLGLLPLLLLFFHNAITPKRRIWWTVGTGFVLLLTLLHSAEQFVFGGLASGLLGLVALYTAEQRSVVLKRLLLAASSSILLSAPFLFKIYKITKSPLIKLDKSLESFHHQPDIVQFFLPTTYSKFTCIPFLDSVSHYNHSRIETAVFLTWIGLLLFIVALVKNNPQARPWIILTIFYVVFALGPDLRIFDNDEFTKYSMPIIMPYALLTSLSVFEFLRTPGRFMLVGFVGMGVVIAYGFDYISTRLPRQWQRNLWFAVVIGMLLFENWPPPYPQGKLPQVPDFYKQIASDTDSYGVFDIPFRPYEKQEYSSAYTVYSSYYQILQMTHGKGIASGYIDRAYKKHPLFGHFISDTIHELLEQSRIQVNGHPSNRYANMMYLLTKLGYRYVVFHKPSPEYGEYRENSWGEQQAYQFIDTVFGNVQPFVNDDLTTVYNVPTVTAPSTLKPAMALVGVDNWPISPATFFVASPQLTVANFEIVVDDIQVPNTKTYFQSGQLHLDSAMGFTAVVTTPIGTKAQLPVILEPDTQVITLTIQSDESRDDKYKHEPLTINIRYADLQVSQKTFPPPDIFINGQIQQNDDIKLRALYGDGWYKADAPTWRWAASPAELFVFSSKKQSIQITMNTGFLNDAEHPGKTIESGIMMVYLNDEMLQNNKITLTQPYKVDIPLQCGWNRIKFMLANGNFQPALVDATSGDFRELSFAITRLDIDYAQ